MKKSYKSISIISLFSVLAATNAASAAGQLDKSIVAQIIREKTIVTTTEKEIFTLAKFTVCTNEEPNLDVINLTKCCIASEMGDEATCKQQTLDIVEKSTVTPGANSGGKILCGQNMIRLAFGQSRNADEFLFETKSDYDMVKDNIQGLGADETFRHSDTYVKNKVYECDDESCNRGSVVTMPAGHVFKGSSVGSSQMYMCDTAGMNDDRWRTVKMIDGQKCPENQYNMLLGKNFPTYRHTADGKTYVVWDSNLPNDFVNGCLESEEQSFEPYVTECNPGIEHAIRGIYNENGICTLAECERGYIDKGNLCEQIIPNVTICENGQAGTGVWVGVKSFVYNEKYECVVNECEDNALPEVDEDGVKYCIAGGNVLDEVVVVGKRGGAPCSPEDLRAQNATAGRYVNNGVEMKCFATECPSGAYLVKINGVEQGYCHHESACPEFKKLNIIDGKYTDKQCVREKFEPLIQGKISLLDIPSVSDMPSPTIPLSTLGSTVKSESQINADKKRQEVAQDIADINAKAQAKKQKILQEAAEDAERERLGMTLVRYNELKLARKELGESAPAIDAGSLDDATRKKLDRVDADAQKDKERAIEKYEKSVERDAERAERKAEREAEKAERDAERAAKKAEKDAERAAEQQKKQAGLDVLADAKRRAAEKKQAAASAQTSETTSGASQQSAPAQPAVSNSDSEFIIYGENDRVRCQTLKSQYGGWVEAGNKCIRTTGTPSSSTSSTAGVSSAATTARQDRNEQLKQQERAAPAYESTQSATKSAVSESGVWTKVYEFERKISPDDVNTEAMALEQRVISTARGDYARENGVTSGFYSEVNVVDKKRTYNFQDGIANFTFKVELKISK